MKSRSQLRVNTADNEFYFPKFFSVFVRFADKRFVATIRACLSGR